MGSMVDWYGVMCYSPGLSEDLFHKRVSFSAVLEALLEMQPIFHDQVVTSYVDLIAAAADVPLNDVEYGINATDMTVVDLAVMFPPQGKQPIAA